MTETPPDPSVDEVLEDPIQEDSDDTATVERSQHGDGKEMVVGENSQSDSEMEHEEDSDNSAKLGPDGPRPTGEEGRFFSWVKRLFSTPRSSRSKVADTADSALPPSEEAADSVENLTRLIKKRERELSRMAREEEIHHDQAQKLRDRLDSETAELVRVRSWVTGLQRSYYWQVQESMGDNLNRAKSDLAVFEREVESLDLPERNVLVAERKIFHKRLGRLFLSVAIPASLWFLLPWLMSFQPSERFISFLSSPWFTILTVLVVGVTVGILSLVRRALGSDRLTIPRIVRSAMGLAVPLILVALFMRNINWLSNFLVPLIQRFQWEVILSVLITFIFGLLSLLTIYYSKWSEFRREVLEKSTRLENVARGYRQSKEELRRLENLYEQLGEWLELLAHSLYRPWKVDPEWQSNQTVELAAENFPFSLRVAQAVDTENARIANLERLIRERLMIQGWRYEAFEDTLASIAVSLGRDPSDITPDVLDSDLPHQTNNSRALVRKYLEGSAARSREDDLAEKNGDSTGVGTDDAYLVEVARDRLRRLIEQTQSSVLAEARPDVLAIGDDPLRDIKVDAAGFDVGPEYENWDEFLKDSLGYIGALQPPLSAITFGDEGVLARGHEDTKSFVLIPERLSDHFEGNDSNRVRIVPLHSSTAATPAELIVRFDCVGPLPFSHVRLVEGLDEQEGKDVASPDSSAG